MDRPCLSYPLNSCRRGPGVAPVRARHVLRQSAMALSAVAPHMGGNALAAMEYLDRPRRGAGVHLLAEQTVWHRVRMLSTSTFFTCRPTNLPSKASMRPSRRANRGQVPKPAERGRRRRRLDGGWPGENNAIAERVGLIQVEFSSRLRVTDRGPDCRQPLTTRS